MEDVNQIDFSSENDMELFTPVEKEEPVKEAKKQSRRPRPKEDELINCLRKELVRVEYIKINDPKAKEKGHPWEGGMASGARHSYVLPTLRDGRTFVDPLTKAEKDFLESYMGLEDNALSIYNTKDNFWENRQVILDKDGIVLDLSNPNDYISYKILLANKDTICPSPKTYRERPLATYRFMLVSDSQKASDAKEKSTAKADAWKAYLAIEDNFDALRCVVESLEGKNISADTDVDFLKERAQEFLEKNPTVFVKFATDKLIPTKILLRKAVDANIITRKGDYYYYNNAPLCGKNADPTFTVAAAYVANPKNQELKFSIEAKLK